jgi:hypothetical protein
MMAMVARLVRCNNNRAAAALLGLIAGFVEEAFYFQNGVIACFDPTSNSGYQPANQRATNSA